jgi:hypothetical protein
MEKVKQHRLYEIGDALVERYSAGTLEFSSFQAWFREAVEICGPEHDGLEMFAPVIRDRAWHDWMTQYLRDTAARRVA